MFNSRMSLETRGYKLRPRYFPDWVASWLGASTHRNKCEDGQVARTTIVMDATRLSDGTLVSLKQIKASKHPNEVEICALFTAEPLMSDPRNHCVPDDDDMILIIMPFLADWDTPKFTRLGRSSIFAANLSSLCLTVPQGLQVIHNHNVAHRDCKANNILMDCEPLYPEPRHPIYPDMKRDWSGWYYIIDFGLFRQYPPDEPRRPMDNPGFDGDRTVPEFQTGDLCDSFAVDIYSFYVRAREGLVFLLPLIEDMVQDDPNLRPTIDDVAEEFARIRSRLRWWTLRARVAEKDEAAVLGFVCSIIHRTKQGLVGGCLQIPFPLPSDGLI
ncbi:kinase-like domain-containing protein [Mycena epipterygia]|nr:kinase-like domain-containing protein [Mycena epipterygia]